MLTYSFALIEVGGLHALTPQYNPENLFSVNEHEIMRCTRDMNEHEISSAHLMQSFALPGLKA